MTHRSRILVVDDDPGIRAMLEDYLVAHQFEVRLAADGPAMRAEIENHLPDLVLLDVHLPGEDGISLARFLRERFDVAIIMVTGATDLIDRVVGLEVGADDYVAKPFDPRELLARVRSVLRRSSSVAEFTAAAPAPTAAPEAPAAAEPPPSFARIAVGRCLLEVDSHRLLTADGEDVPITAMEFELLRAFVRNPNRVLSRDQLMLHSRNRERDPLDRAIDIRIGRLRRKIEPDPEEPTAIRTVRNAGYMFVPI
jgi:two-component system phosphate regulon response regulator OmpR